MRRALAEAPAPVTAELPPYIDDPWGMMRADPNLNDYLNNRATSEVEEILDIFTGDTQKLTTERIVEDPMILGLHSQLKVLRLLVHRTGDYSDEPSGITMGRVINSLLALSGGSKGDITHLPSKLHRYNHALNRHFLQRARASVGPSVWDDMSSDARLNIVHDAFMTASIVLASADIPRQPGGRHRRLR